MGTMTGPLFALVLACAQAAPPTRYDVSVDLRAVPASALRGPHIGFAEGGQGTVRHLSVDDQGLAILSNMGLSWTPLPGPPDTIPAPYHTPVDMVDALDGLASTFPETVRRVDLGWSVDGRPIVAVRITNAAEPEGHVRVLGAHHGDELISAEVALAFAKHLAATPDLTASLLDHVAVWVVPHVNPDGVAALTRHNARDVDLNRNYPYQWSSDEFRPGNAPLSEPETRAIEALALRAPPSLGLSLHSGATNFGWVWNHTVEPAADAAHHQLVAESYAQWCTAEGFWITNGAEWYPTNGDTNDWAYGYWGTFDYTVELSPTKTPPADQIETWIDAHLDSLVHTVNDSSAFRGHVTDRITGRPVRSILTRSSRGPPFRTTDDGRFQLHLSDFGAPIEVSAPGYETHGFEPTSSTAAIVLTPIGRSSDRTLWPPVIHLRDFGQLRLDEPASEVSLLPPGRPEQPVEVSGRSLFLTSEGLPPGLWGVVVDGRPLARPLLVDAPDAAPILDRQVLADRLVLELAAGGTGRQAWLYLDGQLQEKQWIDQTGTELTIDLAGWPTNARIDVALHAPGGVVWVADVFNGAWTASVSPPGTDGLDTGLQSALAARPVACGCTSTPVPPSLILGWIWMGWLRRRDP
ncbi:MAG TPA: hypothetical protein DFR83_17755 [Deltaproteobacteria bacterium]|nr:hypothetical protein [Deltaproteobacteria bacterium]